MPPSVLPVAVGCLRVCRLTMLTPCTVTRWACGSTAMISPTMPLSLPAMTLTRSPLRTWSEFAIQITSGGANETMRMNFFSRSSRPTGPKMRVPRGGSPSLFRMTAAFSSNLM